MTEMNERIKGERKLTKIMETTNEGFIEVDLELNILDVNPSTCEMLGFEKKDIINRNLKSFVDEINMEIILAEHKEKTNKRN